MFLKQHLNSSKKVRLCFFFFLFLFLFSSLWPQYCQEKKVHYFNSLFMHYFNSFDLNETIHVCKVMHKLKSVQNQDLWA